MNDQNHAPNPQDTPKQPCPWAEADRTYQADRERRERAAEREAVMRQNDYLSKAGYLR
jgi:hypothetical protein